ncbi:serine hydrolase domain-containing protein [Photobacterium aquae]|uniref:serine hydrolase domain-containing protein n=1 Tax=Photobacterium aquae TaxID=1195763 RepID=UPI00069D036A|nr:serine hydrolase [Photobacterium aquae]
MKHYFKRVPKISMILVSVFLLSIPSAFSQTKADKNPYTGVFQSENDSTINFIVLERNGKIIARNVWGVEELDLNEAHSFTLKEWGLTGQFSGVKEAKFQKYVEEINGQQHPFNRINVEPSIPFLYNSNPNFTDFSAVDQESCSEEYKLHSLAKNSKHPEKIEKLIKQIKSDRYGWGKQDSLLIYKDNKLLIEEYFNGWERNDPHQLQSVSKSITSLLLGSLITEGKLTDVNAPIIKFLPQYARILTADKSKITLANFLNMSAGLEWDEWSVPYTDPKNTRTAEMGSDDSVAFTLKRSLTNKPGEHFSYSGGYVSVVGGVIDTATKLPTVADYARDSALSALCFKNSFWSKQNDGKTNTAGGAMMRPLDMLKVGQLMLNEGIWQGKQVIDKQWVIDSMNPETNPYNDTYGYFWWHNSYSIGEKNYSAVLASGWGGQEIAIIKELNLVVVKTASNFAGQSQLPTMMKRFILPAFFDN